VIRGRNFRPDMEVLWAGQPVRARIDTEQAEFEIPKTAKIGSQDTIALRTGRGRELPVGIFEVAAGDSGAEQRKLDLERKRAAELAAATRQKALAADRAAREAEVRKRIEERETTRDRRRAARIAALRARWDREFLGDPQTQDELTLHAQRTADLVRMQEVADLGNNQRLAVRVELALARETARHDRRMTGLKAVFKGGKP
jgi:hypothetical protein